jgi:hypothetical protein
VFNDLLHRSVLLQQLSFEQRENMVQMSIGEKQMGMLVLS